MHIYVRWLLLCEKTKKQKNKKTKKQKKIEKNNKTLSVLQQNEYNTKIASKQTRNKKKRLKFTKYEIVTAKT